MNQCEKNYRMMIFGLCNPGETPSLAKTELPHTALALGSQDWARRVGEGFPEEGAFYWALRHEQEFATGRRVFQEATAHAKVRRQRAEHFFGGGDEADEAREVGRSRLGWALEGRLGEREEGGSLGQIKWEIKWVAMAVCFPPSWKTTGNG